jgi:F0F1-type ATP synthase membrane subunit b/b'
MSERNATVMEAIARIEQQADELASQAQAEAAELRKQARRDIAELVKATDREIEEAQAKLAKEYQAKTEQALTQIDVDFMKERELLQQIRDKKMDALIAWAASRIGDQLGTPESNGD